MALAADGWAWWAGPCQMCRSRRSQLSRWPQEWPGLGFSTLFFLFSELFQETYQVPGSDLDPAGFGISKIPTLPCPHKFMWNSCGATRRPHWPSPILLAVLMLMRTLMWKRDSYLGHIQPFWVLFSEKRAGVKCQNPSGETQPHLSNGQLVPHSPIIAAVVPLLSLIWFFVTPWTAARQAPQSSTIFCILLQFMSIESVTLSNHHILCSSLLLLPSIFPGLRAFSNESALCIRWGSRKS